MPRRSESDLAPYLAAREEGKNKGRYCMDVNCKPSKEKRLQVPGFGDIPLNATSSDLWAEDEWPFRGRTENAVEDWAGSTFTIRERDMMKFMNEITDKPDWTRKIKDEAIVKKWRAELEELEKDVKYTVFSDNMFEAVRCISELVWYADRLNKHEFIPAIDADATVCKSDTLVTKELKEELRAAAQPLEDVPAAEKDWHPGSNDQVLDLVHPSLFPLLYGRSRVLPDQTVGLHDCVKYTGLGEIIEVPDEDDIKADEKDDGPYWGRNTPKVLYSQRFQWLPSEVAFRDNDGLSITSYINNLAPGPNKPLYAAVEKVLAAALPMLNESLASTGYSSRPTRIHYDGVEYLNNDQEPSEEELEKLVEENDWDEDEKYEYLEEYKNSRRTLVRPEPKPEFTQRISEMSAFEGLDLRRDFADQGLQVIVKLANIHLTPEKPNYDGGSWHIEGSLNEHICATALYYYDSVNTTESSLAFRHQVSREDLEETSYDQSDHDHFEALFGIQNDDSCLQELGAVRTPEGRLLTFPNVLQHRVQPFSLADKTKPGHRKILAIFLIDPFVRILSTANVPPQQKDWWAQMVTKLDKVSELPPELVEHVVDSADDFPISLSEAKELRLELMAERTAYQEAVEGVLSASTFGFCEH